MALTRYKRIGFLTGSGLVLALVLGVFLGAGGYTFYYAKGYSYLVDDPTVCVNCHIMRPQYESWQHSSHHAVASCNDCHIPHDLVGKYAVKMENGFWHSYKFTFQNFHEPIQIRDSNSVVLQRNCVHCHGELVHGVLEDAALEGEPRACVRCHQGVGHGAAQRP